MKKSETNNISETLTSIVDFFQRHRIPYALIGAMALNIYGRPRTTLDIDFLILLDEPGFSNIKDKASTINFRIDEEGSVPLAVEIKKAYPLGNQKPGL